MKYEILLITDESSQRTSTVIDLMSLPNLHITHVSEERDYSTYEQLSHYDCIAYSKSFASLTHWLTNTQMQLPYFTAPIVWITDIEHPKSATQEQQQSLIQWQSLPCSQDTLLATLIQAITQWKNKYEVTQLTHNAMTLSFHSRCLQFQRQRVFLTISEFDLLAYLFVHHSAPVSTEDISAAIRENRLDNLSSLRVLVCRLRKKMLRIFRTPLLQSCRGKGYWLEDPKK